MACKLYLYWCCIFPPHPMMMLMVVMIIFICDQREECFHQIKVVDPAHHHQHLVNVVWSFFLLTVMGMLVAAGFVPMHMQT